MPDKTKKDADNPQKKTQITQKKTQITQKKDADNPPQKKDADNRFSRGGGCEQFRKVGRAQGLGLCASDSGFRVQGLGFDVPLKGSIRVTIGIYKGTIL